MIATQPVPANRIRTRTVQSPKRRPSPTTPVSEKRVRELLLGITYALHTTRVVGHRELAPRKG